MKNTNQRGRLAQMLRTKRTRRDKKKLGAFTTSCRTLEALEDRHLLAVSVLGTAGQGTVGTSQFTGTFNHTVPMGNDRLLVLTAGDGLADLTSATFNAMSLTQAVQTSNNDSEIWYVKLGSGAAVTGPVTVTYNANTAGAILRAQAFAGVDQTTPVSNPTQAVANVPANNPANIAAINAALTLSVPSAPGDMVVDIITGEATTPVVGAGQTGIGTVGTFNFGTSRSGASYEPGAASVSMDWTAGVPPFRFVSHAGLNINQSVALAPPTTTIAFNSISVDSGSSSTDFITNDNNGLTFNGTLTSALVAGEKAEFSPNNGSTWVDVTTSVTGTSLSYADTALTSTNTAQLRVTNASGSSTASTQLVTIDIVAPTNTVTVDSITDDTGVSSTDFITMDANGLTIGATLSPAIGSTDIVEYSSDNGATFVPLSPTSIIGGTTISHTDASLTSTNTVQFRVKDIAGNTGTPGSQLVTIDTVAPTAVTLSPSDIDENTDTSAGPVDIGTLTSNDNLSTVFTYALVSGTGDTDNGSFVIAGDKLQVNQNEVLDFETQPSYSVRVESKDEAGNATEQQLTVLVNDDTTPTLTGTPGDDVFYVVLNGPNVEIRSGGPSGPVLLNEPIATLVNITINGGDGDDTLTVDLSGGDVIPPNGIFFNGNGQAGGDSLIVIGDGTNTGAYTPDSTTNGNGLVFADTIGNITFTGLEPVQVSAFPAFTFISPNSDDIITIADGVGMGGEDALNVSGTSGGIGFEDLTVFDVATFTVDLGTNDAGTPDDDVTYNNLTTPQGIASVNVNTGAGDDFVEIAATATSTMLGVDTGVGNDTTEVGGIIGTVENINGIVNLNDAGGSDDWVVVSDISDPTGDTVVITDASVTGASPAAINFVTPFEVVWFVGGTEADDVTVTPSATTEFNLNGNDPTTTPGDILTIDALGNAINLTATTVTVAGMEPVDYFTFESLNLINPGDVTVTGDGNDNTLNVSGGVDESLTLVLDGGPEFTVDSLTPFLLTFDGLGGNDTLIADYAANGFFNSNIDFNGGTETAAPGDALEIIGTFDTQTLNYLPPGPDGHNGDVVLELGPDASTITYTGLEPINAGNAADTILNLPNGVMNDATLQDNTTVGFIEIIDNGFPTTFENTVIPNPTNSLTVNLGDMGDLLSVNALDPGFSADLTIVGSALGLGETVSVLAAGPTPLKTLGGDVSITAETVDGNGDIDTDGGDVTVDAVLSIDLGFIITDDFLGGGAIDLSADGNITTTDLWSFSAGPGSVSGDISVSSANGAVDTTGGSVDAENTGDNGQAGNVTITGDLNVDVASISTIAVGVGSTSGDVDVSSTSGAVDITGIVFAVNYGDSGQAGTVTISGDSNVDVGPIETFALGVGSTSGDVNVSSTSGTVDVTGHVVASNYGDNGQAGDVTITGDLDVDVDEIETFATGLGSISGDINVSSTSGYTTTNNRLVADNYSPGADQAGNVTISGDTGVLVGDDISTVAQGFASTSGNISVSSASGSVDATAGGLLAFNDGVNGQAGNVTISGDMSVRVGDIFTDTFGLGGQAGNVDIDGETVEFSQVVATNITGAIDVDAFSNIEMLAGSVISAESGPITLDAFGFPGGNYAGISLTDATIETTDGPIALFGIGGDTGDDNHGVFVNPGSVIESTGTGGVDPITIDGLGGGSAIGGNGNHGVHVQGSVQSVDGDLEVDGVGGVTTGNDNLGVLVALGGDITSTGMGSITVDGDGGLGTTSVNRGVTVFGGSISASGGGVDITGTGGGSFGDFNIGVSVLSGGVVEDTAGGDVTIMGTGGDGTNVNFGVEIGGLNTTVSSADGDLTITGISTDATGFGQHGVRIADQPLITVTGSGRLDITGTAGNATSSGVSIEPADTLISTASGPITVTAVTGPITTPFGIPTADIISGGPLTIVGDLQPGGVGGIGVTPVASNTTFMGGSEFSVDITGNGGAGDEGVEFDQLDVTGTVEIEPGVALNVSGPGAMPGSFMLIRNDGTDAIVGEFAGLSDGDPLPMLVGGQQYHITYVGGDGNDVVLYSKVSVEFDDAMTSAAENALPAGSAGPTLVIQGDLSLLSAAQRTVMFTGPTGTEIDGLDHTTTPTLEIPAAGYPGGTNLASQFNLIQYGRIVINNDALLEGDELFTVSVADNGVFVLGDSDGDLTAVSSSSHDIVDDEVGVLDFVSANKPESPGTAEVLLTITGSQGTATDPFKLAPEVTLSAEVVDSLTGTANPNVGPVPNSDDYDYVTSTATFAPGTATGSTSSVPLNILSELVIEADETIDFELQNLMDGRASTGDNDLNGQASLGSNGTITIVNDDSASVIVEHIGGSTDVTEGGATDTYTVRLGGIPTLDVPLVVWPQASQLDLGNGPGNGITVTFTPFNALVPQTVTVVANDDVIVEGPHSDVIGHLATGFDPFYMGLPIVNLPVNITDNDNTATPAIVITNTSVAVTEGGATDTYSVALASIPTSSVDVVITPDAQLDLGAGAGLPVTLNFAADPSALTPQTVTVTAFDDAVVEGTHFGSITHSSTSGDAGYNGLVGSGITAVITDNDFVPVPFTPTNISVGSSSWAGTPYQLTNNLAHTGTSGFHGRTLSWVNLDTITVAYTGSDPVAGDLVLSDASLATTFVGAGGGVATWTVADAGNPLSGVVAGVTTQLGPKDNLTLTTGGLSVTVDVVPGDIDASFITDIGDVLAWVSQLGAATPGTSAPNFSDVDGSGLTDVGDVQAIILANGAASTPAAAALDSVFASESAADQRRVDFGTDLDRTESQADDRVNRRRSRSVSRRGAQVTSSDTTVEVTPNDVDGVFASLADDRFGQF